MPVEWDAELLANQSLIDAVRALQLLPRRPSEYVLRHTLVLVPLVNTAQDAAARFGYGRYGLGTLRSWVGFVACAVRSAEARAAKRTQARHRRLRKCTRKVHDTKEARHAFRRVWRNRKSTSARRHSSASEMMS